MTEADAVNFHFSAGPPAMRPSRAIERAAVFEDDAFGPALLQQFQSIPLLGFRTGCLDKEKVPVCVALRYRVEIAKT